MNDLLREKNSQLEKRFAEVEVKLDSAESLLAEVTQLKAKLAESRGSQSSVTNKD